MISERDITTPNPDSDEPFKVEEHVKVYLVWDAEDKRWTVDGPTFDGSPLDGLEGGPETLYGYGVDLTPEEEAIFAAAAKVDLPTGEEVYHLLAEHLAPVVFKVGLAPADAGVKPAQPVKFPHLNDAQRATIAFHDAFNVVDHWSVTELDEAGAVSAYGIGPGFVWHLAIDADGTSATRESSLFWNTGISA